LKPIRRKFFRSFQQLTPSELIRKSVLIKGVSPFVGISSMSI
jgi:hypothetical protein